MTLAEALALRADMLTTIEDYKSRLLENARLQEGEEPAEQPEQLLRAIDDMLGQLQTMIHRINDTNIHTRLDDGMTIEEAINKRDTMRKKLSILHEAISASKISDRYNRYEIRFITPLDVPKLHAQREKLSRDIRLLDLRIQKLNWITELR